MSSACVYTPAREHVRMFIYVWTVLCEPHWCEQAVSNEVIWKVRHVFLWEVFKQAWEHCGCYMCGKQISLCVYWHSLTLGHRSTFLSVSTNFSTRPEIYEKYFVHVVKSEYLYQWISVPLQWKLIVHCSQTFFKNVNYGYDFDDNDWKCTRLHFIWMAYLQNTLGYTDCKRQDSQLHFYCCSVDKLQ